MYLPVRPAFTRVCSAGHSARALRSYLGPTHTHQLTHSSAAATAMTAMEDTVLLTAYNHNPADRQAFEQRLSQEEFSEAVCFAWPDGLPALHKQQAAHPDQLPPRASFNGHLYMSHLTSASLGKVLLTVHEIGSTQDFMRAHHSRLPLGTVLMAEKQVSGKGRDATTVFNQELVLDTRLCTREFYSLIPTVEGRGGNQWTSPPGCLMFTASRPLAILGAQAPFVNYVVCLGVLRGIRDALAITCPGLPPINIRIKWPNDIYYVPNQQIKQQETATLASSQHQHQQDNGGTMGPGALKIGGALMHTTWSGGKFNLLVGIGLNKANRQPTTCLQALLEEALVVEEARAGGTAAAGQARADVSEAVGETAQHVEGVMPKIQAEVLLSRVISHLDECLQIFESQGFGPLETDYLDAWLHTDQRVMFEKHAEQSVTAVHTTSNTTPVTALPLSSAAASEACAGAGAGSRSHAPVAEGGAISTLSTSGKAENTLGINNEAGSTESVSEKAEVVEKELVALRIKGLSSSGFLLAEEEGTGRQYELTPDGNSLDMLAGLIRKKLG